MTDFSRISAHWFKWLTMIGVAGVRASTDSDAYDVAFLSDDNSVYLRQVGGWWKIDTVNDRGQRYDDVASFSNFELVEKFLIWRWATLARSMVGARQLGAELQSRGPSNAVEFVKTSREYVVELRLHDDVAVVPEAGATVFSHIMTMSIDEIERRIAQDIS